jgi:nicotinamide phosphoribosyltransferase
LKFNPILATDSYKLSHAKAYPKGVTGMFSYIEARTGGRDIMIPFGMQMWVKKFLTQPVTYEHIKEAEEFAQLHGEPFDAEPWAYLVRQYKGLMPVVIRAVPEGTPVPSGHVMVTNECTDPKLYWLSAYLETALQRGVWYPTTIATMDYDIKRDIANFYRISGADVNMLPFALHDFGARGVSSPETAEIGGAAHLVNFMGSDTIEGIRAANYYYKSRMAGFSVPATEHSVECSFGSSDEQEKEYISHVLNTYARHNSIVSIVIDGYDTYRAARVLCTEFKDRIINSGAKVVFRPDSGDMMEVVPRLLEMQAKSFGFVVNEKGYKKINNVGILQGDGVDHMTIKSLLGRILAMGFSADNVVFGSGGSLLQKVNRDTYKFAQKASAILKDGVWVGIAKNPVTDPGKQSKQGRLTLVRSKVNGEYMTVDMDKPLDVEFEEVMRTIWDGTQLLVEDTLEQIRARCAL